MDSAKNLPVAVIGAGPVGLAAAAHLIERGLEPLILEAGPTAGAAIEQWRHIRLFSPWRYNTDAAAVRLLAATGWESPRADGAAHGGELIDQYLGPAGRTAGDRVPPAHRRPRHRGDPRGHGQDPQPEPRHHTLRRPGRTRRRRSPRLPGRRRHRRLRHLVHPQPARDLRPARRRRRRRRGPDLLAAAGRPGRDREAFAGRRAVVVGAGHSAANTLLNLAELAPRCPGPGSSGRSAAPPPPRSTAAATPTGWPPAASSAARLRRLVESGTMELHTGFGIAALTAPTAPSP